MMDEVNISFQGEVELSGGQAALCAATIRYHQWNPEELSVDLLWLGDDGARREGSLALRYLGVNHFWVNSRGAYYLPAELLGITGVSSQSMGTSVHSSRISVSAVQIGITKTHLSEDKNLNVTVRLQPSGILCLPAIHNQIFNGEVVIEQLETGAVEIGLTGGALEARETYEYNKHEL